MNTKEFLEAVWPPEGRHVIAILGPDGMRHSSYDNAEAAANAALMLDYTEGTNVFYACSSYKPGRGRSRADCLSAKAFWCDIDCGKSDGYATKDEAIVEVSNWSDTVGLPKPMIVDSGNGVHVYWLMTKSIRPDEWVHAAKGLKHSMEEHGVKFDPSRSTDLASLLRPVGCRNKKDPSRPLEVKLIQEGVAVEPSVILDIADKLLGTPDFDNVPAFLSGETVEPVVEFTESDYSAKLIADKCPLMGRFRDTKGDVDYETWRLLIGLMTFCTEGVDLAREWSSKRIETGHTNTDVDTRFSSWNAGPSTCAAFASACAGNCEGCPFRNKIKTPLILGRVVPESKPETIEVTMEDDARRTKITAEVPELPAGYTWDGKSLIHWVQSKDKGVQPHRFCNSQFYIVGRIRDADGSYEYVVRLHLPDNSVREFTMAGESIGQGGSKLFGILGSKEIFISNASDAGQHMCAYLRDQVGKIMSVKGIMPTYSSFGWQKDGSFLIGRRLYKPDGTVSEALLSGYAEDIKDALPLPKGSLEEYTKALNAIYARRGMEPMQYVICSMLASPLVAIFDPSYVGIPVVITGAASGKGKTTACMAALYAFGDALKLTIAGDAGATPKARSALLGTMSDLPVLFDEVTNMKPEALSQLAYALSNGMEPMRLRAGAGGVRFAGRETWHLQAACTGNTYVGARLADAGQTEAEAMRLFELRIDGYNVPVLDPVEVAGDLNTMALNSGCAGEAYISWLVTHKDDFIRMAQETRESIQEDQKLVGDPKYRFFRNHVILTLTCAKILKEIGIVKFDIDALRQFAMQAVADLFRLTEETNAVDYMEALRKLIACYQLDIFQSPSFKLPAGSPPYEVRVKNYLVGRAIASNAKTKDEKFADCLLLSVTAVSTWCNMNRVDMTALANFLAEAGILTKRNTVIRLATSTNLPSVPQRCWVMDYKKINAIGEGED